MPSTKAYNASCRVEYLNEHSVLKKRSQNHVRLHFSSKIPYSFDTRGTVTLGRTRKFIPPPWYKGGGGWMEPLPGVFDMLQYFETILPLVETL